MKAFAIELPNEFKYNHNLVGMFSQEETVNGQGDGMDKTAGSDLES